MVGLGDEKNVVGCCIFGAALELGGGGVIKLTLFLDALCAYAAKSSMRFSAASII